MWSILLYLNQSGGAAYCGQALLPVGTKNTKRKNQEKTNVKNDNYMNEHVEIYTDGACKGNPGVGGWGAWLKYNGNEKTIFGGEENTTNNRMEMTAVIRALEALKRTSEVKLYTDSSYVQKGMMEWMEGWKSRNWRTANKKPVKNDDLWKQLDTLANLHQIEWIWVKGHAGNQGNERADELANAGVDQVLNNKAT